MPLPGNIGNAVPDGPDWIARAIRDLQREVATQRTATPKGSVRVASGHDDSQNYALTKNVWHTLATVTLNAPDGYGQTVVAASGNVTMTNIGAGSDFFEARILVNGATQGYAPTSGMTASGESEGVSASTALVVDNASTITVEIQAASFLQNWPSGGAPSGANLDVTAVFVR